MGKTETIRQRRVDVWVPTLEAKERWKEVAAEQGLSLSTMVIQLVEQAINEGVRDTSDIDHLRQRIMELEAEIDARDARIQDLVTLKDRLENDLDAYRTQDLLRPGGMKILDRRLIEVLAGAKGADGRPRAVTEDELQRRLRVKGNADQIQALSVQLEALELHGVVQGTQKGWVWHGH